MSETIKPKAHAKNLIAIYKGDTKRAADAVRSMRDAADPYWAAVLACIAEAEVRP